MSVRPLSVHVSSPNGATDLLSINDLRSPTRGADENHYQSLSRRIVTGFELPSIDRPMRYDARKPGAKRTNGFDSIGEWGPPGISAGGSSDGENWSRRL